MAQAARAETRSKQALKINEFFSRQTWIDPIEKAKTDLPRDNAGGEPFKNLLKKTLSE
jgi:hypothetical protein